jgi:high affinity Mn2+ porin
MQTMHRPAKRLVVALAVLCLGTATAAQAAPAADTGEQPEVPEDWMARFQSTGIYQAHPSFPSPLRGPNSLPSDTELRETLTATAYLATRPWRGAEFYVDPEATQGFGLGHTVGIAGFPNGEASKAGSNTPKVALARYFVRQVIGLGGDTEFVGPDTNQLASRYDVNRLTLTFGKMSASDFLDENAYSHDPRTQFMNWSLWESAAWDYPADARGYTYGAVADLNQKRWALRWGWFLMPREANAKALEARFLHTFGTAVELETRHEILGQPGKLRWLAFANKANMGSYSAALAAAAGSGSPPQIAAVRSSRVKWGGALNLEQAITDELGLFTRLSWNDGRSESFAFTEIDRSAALGLSLKGKEWGREHDTVGMGYVVNGIAEPHRRYLAAGGLGFLLGDGALAYGPERILESYYDIKLLDPLDLAFDYQHVANPGYDRLRGPVHVFAARVHVEF